MSLQQHVNDIRQLVSPEDLENAALLASNEALALRQLAIQERGVGVDGRFSDYTDAYAQTRQKEGYQTSYKDYTRTGELFRSIQPRVTGREVNAVVVTIGPRNEANLNKLRGALRKDGTILANTEEEIELVAAAFRDRINNSLPY